MPRTTVQVCGGAARHEPGDPARRTWVRTRADDGCRPGADAPATSVYARLRRLVSSLRAHGGVAAVSAACHRDVPGVDGVVLAVFAAHAGRIIISDSGPDGDQLEDLHSTLGEGPGVDAAVTGEPVTAVDLDHPRGAPELAEVRRSCGDLRGSCGVRRPRPAAAAASQSASSLSTVPPPAR